ncbi:hypothetical protein SGLAM104S_09300 [Streptomyces glaucescens]
MTHVLIVSGGSHLHDLLRDADPDIRTSVICRASALPLVSGVGENRAVIVLADDTPLAGWLAAARLLHQERPVSWSPRSPRSTRSAPPPSPSGCGCPATGCAPSGSPRTRPGCGAICGPRYSRTSRTCRARTSPN